MNETLPTEVRHLPETLAVLVDRGTVTSSQREAILGELGAGQPSPRQRSSRGGRTRRRPVGEILVEIGLYLGSALVVAAGLVLVAQNWSAMSLGTQVAVLALIAVLTGGLGAGVGHGSVLGSARRRLGGVLFAACAISAAGTCALVLDDSQFTALGAAAVALAVMVLGNTVASSTLTEVAVFGTGLATVTAAFTAFAPEGALSAQEEVSVTSYEVTTSALVVGLCVLWALVASHHLVHREVAVFVGMLAALGEALSIIDHAESEALGIAVMGALAAVGLWRFLVEGYWPWIASAIASLTAVIFWMSGGADSPVVAILTAGIALIAASGAGLLLARRRAGSADPASGGAPPR